MALASPQTSLAKHVFGHEHEADQGTGDAKPHQD